MCHTDQFQAITSLIELSSASSVSMKRYVHRDVPPGKASKYVSPRLGIVRAGNGLYWQFGLIRAERSSEEESEGRGRSPLASQEPGSLNFNDQDTTIGRGSGRAKSRGTPVLGSDAAAGGGVSSKSRDAEASSSSIGNGSASASSRHMASSPSCDGCSVVSRCEDNVEGSMPKWLMSVMASKGAPTYVNTLQVCHREFHLEERDRERAREYAYAHACLNSECTRVEGL